jgi:hypothetical protein
MKTKVIITATTLLFLLLVIIISCQKKEVNEENPANVSDAVKTYFGIAKTTGGLSNSVTAPKMGYATISSQLKSKKKSLSVWPDFYSNPFDHLFSDSCGLAYSSEINANGDYVYYSGYGENWILCRSEGFEKKGNVTYIQKAKKNLTPEMINNYSIIAHCQYRFPESGKCCNLDGTITIIEFRDYKSMRDINVKIGECNNEMDYKETHVSSYKFISSQSFEIVENGSAQYVGKNASYSTTVIEPLQRMWSTNEYITKGVLKVIYTLKDTKGEFTIDYGDGTEDSKAKITENGKSYEVDYISLQDEMYNSLN